MGAVGSFFRNIFSPPKPKPVASITASKPQAKVSVTEEPRPEEKDKDRTKTITRQALIRTSEQGVLGNAPTGRKKLLSA